MIRRLASAALCLLVLAVAAPARGAVVAVHMGDNLQTKINSASCGDSIEIDAGLTFTGQYYLPGNNCSVDTTLTTAGCQAAVGNRRVALADVSSMAVIESPGGGAQALHIPTYAAGAQKHWIVDCLKFGKSGSETGRAFGIIRCGNSDVDDGFPHTPTYVEQNDVSLIPSHITFRRLIVSDDDDTREETYGILTHCNDVTIKQSYFNNLKEGTESHCFGGYNFEGPLLADDNYCESAGIGSLIGGEHPMIVGIQPNDLTVRNSTYTKRVEWNTGDSGTWNIKNGLEFKTGTNVTITGNTIGPVWNDGQQGQCILLTVTAFHQIISDVLVENNLCHDVCIGMQISGEKPVDSTYHMIRVRVHNNLFIQNQTDCAGGANPGIQVAYAPDVLTIDHNTFGNDGTAVAADGVFADHGLNFVYTNNISSLGAYGFSADNLNGDATNALDNYFPGWTWEGNVQCGWADFGWGSAAELNLPNRANNTYLANCSTLHAEFVDFSGNNLRLNPGSPYTGKGVDFSQLPGQAVTHYRFRFRTE